MIFQTTLQNNSHIGWRRHLHFTDVLWFQDKLAITAVEFRHFVTVCFLIVSRTCALWLVCIKGSGGACFLLKADTITRVGKGNVQKGTQCFGEGKPWTWKRRQRGKHSSASHTVAFCPIKSRSVFFFLTFSSSPPLGYFWLHFHAQLPCVCVCVCFPLANKLKLSLTCTRSIR